MSKGMFNFTKEMAKILRRLRQNANLTQKEVATIMGVKIKYGQSLIAQIEMGKVKNPSLRTILDYLRACGASWVEFFKQLDIIDFKQRHEKMIAQVNPPPVERKIQRDAMKYEINIEFPSKGKEEIDFDRLKKSITDKVLILLSRNQIGESRIILYQKFAREYYQTLKKHYNQDPKILTKKLMNVVQRWQKEGLQKEILIQLQEKIEPMVSPIKKF